MYRVCDKIRPLTGPRTQGVLATPSYNTYPLGQEKVKRYETRGLCALVNERLWGDHNFGD